MNRKLGVDEPLAWLIGISIPLALCYPHYRYIDLWIAKNRSQYFTPERGRAACAAGFSLVAVGLIIGAYFKIYPIK